MGQHTRLHPQVACLTLEDRGHRLWDAEAAEAVLNLTRSQLLDLEPMRFGTGEDARHHYSIARADLQQADFVVELLTTARGELGPQGVSASQHGHVVGMFEVGQADDPGIAVRATTVMARRKAVEAQGSHPPPS